MKGMTTGIAQAQGANIGSKVVRATQFILEDETGKDRAVLGVGKDGSALVLADETGKPRTALIVLKNGPLLTLLDENGNRNTPATHFISRFAYKAPSVSRRIGLSLPGRMFAKCLPGASA